MFMFRPSRGDILHVGLIYQTPDIVLCYYVTRFRHGSKLELLHIRRPHATINTGSRSGHSDAQKVLVVLD